MKKPIINNNLIAIFIAVAIVLVLPVISNAQEADTTKSPDTPVSNTDDRTDNSVVLSEQKASREERLRDFREKRSVAREKIDLGKEQREVKLEARKLDVCKKHETTINNLMSRMSDRGKKRLEMFDKVVERTKVFYTEKGLSVANYDELLVAVDAAKAVAETAVGDTRSSSVTFKCDGTDPRGASLYFKEDLKNQNQAMKNYRSAIKNLIKAVKLAYEETNPTDVQENQ